MDTGETRPSGKLGNYLITLVIEAVCGLFRFAFIGSFAVAAAYAAFAMTTDPSAVFFGNANPDDWVQPALIIAFLLSYSNIFVSLAAYIGLGGGSTVTRFVLGAREPSRREEAKLYEVFGEITARADFPVDSFSRLFILDAPFTYSYVVGTTLYISSGAINDRHLQALLAHELGHLYYGDGETILALRRLVFPIFQFFVGSVRDFSSARPPYRPEAKDFDAKEIFFSLLTKVLFFVLAFLGGGIGVWVMSWSWASYFRKCDYVADAFAVRLGFKDQLIEYLEETKFYDTSIPYMLGWRPSNELRIDRLLHPTEELAEPDDLPPVAVTPPPTPPPYEAEVVPITIAESKPAATPTEPDSGSRGRLAHPTETSSPPDGSSVRVKGTMIPSEEPVLDEGSDDLEVILGSEETGTPRLRGSLLQDN